MKARYTSRRIDPCRTIVQFCTTSFSSLSRFPFIKYIGLKDGLICLHIFVVITNQRGSILAPSGTSSSTSSFQVPHRMRSSITFFRCALDCLAFQRGSAGLSTSVICNVYVWSFRFVGLDMIWVRTFLSMCRW